MSSFSRGFLGLTQHSSFLASSLRSPCGSSTAAFLLRPQHRLLRLSSPSTVVVAAAAAVLPSHAFSSSAQAYAKKKNRPRIVVSPPAASSVSRQAAPSRLSAAPTKAAPKTAPPAAAAATAAATAAAPAKTTASTTPLPTAATARTAPAAAAAASKASSAVHAAPGLPGGGAGTSYADQLGRRASPTVLYEAPSQFWLRTTCVVAGTFCLVYALVQYWTIYLNPPDNLAWWVPKAFLVICACMAGLGGYFFMGGAGIIRSIRAVPAAKLAEVAGAKRAAKTTKALAERATAGSRAEPLPIFLEVEVGRVVPFVRAKKLYVAPAAMTIPQRFARYGLQGTTAAAANEKNKRDPNAPLTPDELASLPPAERIKARRAQEDRRQKEREYEMDHLMTAPFRHAGQAMRYALRGMRRAFSRDGFARVTVDGRRCRLDVQGGWALENGRSLDRLVTVLDTKL